ncbi:uncharacterized protein LOC144169251 isoform X2 [Haemaphysalis longicornis]
MWMLHKKVVLLVVVVFADEGSASIESYLNRLVHQFGVEEAEREESKLNWVDYRHEQLPEGYMYSRVKLTWTQARAHYGPQVKGQQTERQVYSTTVDNQNSDEESKVTVERKVIHTNVYTVWTLDAKDIITIQAFSAGLKGVIATTFNSHESIAKEYEKTGEVYQKEELSVRAMINAAARALTHITWVITEAEAVMNWTVTTTISGSFAISLTNSTHHDYILVFSAAALESVDYNLLVRARDIIECVSRGTMKSVTASASHIHVQETFSKKRNKRSTSSTRDIQVELVHSSPTNHSS